MKTKLLITLLLIAATPALLHAQGGSLTPPAGPIEPTMKSLDLVEARIPLVQGAPGVSINDITGNITISQSGSYYLTSNRTVANGSAIFITSNDVSLAMNGFTLISTSPDNNGSGILIGNSLRNISISNGNIRGSVTNSGGNYSGSGFSSGITYNLNRPANVRVSDVSVAGCKSDGIDLGGKFGNSNIIERCVVRTVGRMGFAANVIRGCSATDCGGTAIVAQTVNDCVSSSTGGVALSADVVSNSHAVGSSFGILAEVSVSHCYGESTSANPGISCSSGTVSFSRGKSASGFAILAAIASGSTTAGGAINSPQKHLGTP
jgi:hypothetical protein